MFLYRYKSFTDIYDYIEKNELQCNEILPLLQKLKEECKQLTVDQSDDVIEDATVLSLRMFLDQDIVMLKHLSQLRQAFGSVQTSTANRICQVITILSKLARNSSQF